MKSRKLGALLVASVATAVLGSGLAAFASPRDDDSPLHMLMEKVQASNATILKGVRTEANFKKSRDDVVKAAEALVKLSKDSRAFTEPAKEQKKTQAEWETLTDAWTKESEKFAELAAKADAKQADTKAAYKAVQKSCTDCHDVFRVDE